MYSTSPTPSVAGYGSSSLPASSPSPPFPAVQLSRNSVSPSSHIGPTAPGLLKRKRCSSESDVSVAPNLPKRLHLGPRLQAVSDSFSPVVNDSTNVRETVPDLPLVGRIDLDFLENVFMPSMPPFLPISPAPALDPTIPLDIQCFDGLSHLGMPSDDCEFMHLLIRI